MLTLTIQQLSTLYGLRRAAKVLGAGGYFRVVPIGDLGTVSVATRDGRRWIVDSDGSCTRVPTQEAVA
jgi:hypothetical protein